MLDLGLLMYAGLLGLAFWRSVCFYECCGVQLPVLSHTSILYIILAASVAYCLIVFYRAAEESLTSVAYRDADNWSAIEWLKLVVLAAPAPVIATILLTWFQTESHIFQIRKRVSAVTHDRAVQIIALPAVFGVMALASMVPIFELVTGRLTASELQSPWYDFEHPLLAVEKLQHNYSQLHRNSSSAQPLGWEEAKDIALWRYETCFYVADLFAAWSLYQFGKLMSEVIEDNIRQQELAQNSEEGSAVHALLARDLLASHGAVTSLTWLGTTIFVVVCIAQTACSLWPYFGGGKDVLKRQGIMFYFQVAGFVASGSAIYNLIIVERAFHRHLEVCSPLMKFLSVKILASLCFIQRGLLVLLQSCSEMLPAVMQRLIRWVPLFGDIVNMSDVQVHLFYPALILMECLLLAVMHCWVWRPSERWYVRQLTGTENEPLHLDEEAPAGLALAATALAAASAAAEASSESKADLKEKSDTQSLLDKVKLPLFVGLCYFFNVQYSIVNEKLLSCFGAVWAVSWIQLAAGIPIAMLMWASGILMVPKVTKDDLLMLAPVGAAFSAGQVTMVASLGAVAVSFTQVVRALEPAVNAIASAFVLGQVFHPLVYVSLVPVFVGVALASSGEPSFTMFGFLTAMASNFAFVARNVLATKFGSVGEMGSDSVTRKTNQLAVLTAVATAVLLPVALVLPGGLLSIPSAWAAAIKSGTSASSLLYMMAASGFHFFMYQMSSFWVLSCVQPITHSVLNTMKRVVIIIVSIIVFSTPVTAQSVAGTAIAIAGVLVYSLTKSYFS